VLDGPAVHPQPCLEVRARDGQIEVRRPKSERNNGLLNKLLRGVRAQARC
jgi:hypothetical protein